ncbi:MAG: hypothetical protein JWN70_5323 [Planctomycetaceae bacterium]|nr:hypothetical protein [Planctomycetaceae bacterium]
MVQEVVFRFMPSLLGSFDEPDPIPHLAGVILLQHGEALVGSWDAECCGFIHPSNQNELAANALEAVLAAYPDVDLKSDTLRIFTCPPILIARYDFGT